MADSGVRQKDIAEKAGVSQAAVSLALNGKSQGGRVNAETQKRIEQVAKELKYSPNIAAKQLRGQRSGLIGVLIGTGAAPVLFDRVSALERMAHECGYRVLVGQVGSDLALTSAYVNDFLGRGLDGVVCMSHENVDDPEAVPELLSRIKNVVYLRQPAIENASFVHIDAAACIHLAIDHLLVTGRRRIGMVILDKLRQANIHRESGYVEAIQRHGLQLDNRLIWVGDESLQPDPHDVSNAKADEVVNALVVEQKADAIIAINDNWAAQLIKAIKRRGLHIPRDVAVIGQGNFQISRFFDPEITTLDPRNDLFAVAAMELLVEKIESDTPVIKDPVTVKPELIVRQSG